LNLTNQKKILCSAKMLTRDERAVREKLEAWELRIQRILALYTDNSTLADDRRPVVRSAYGDLKLGLRAAFKAGDCWEARSHMSDAERRFYQPAIEAASARLVARPESGPGAWYESLCAALSHISDAIVDLNERDHTTQTGWSA
jgi:hypothetical protein